MMDINIKHWQYKWFGFWKEYGEGYELCPSVFNFVLQDFSTEHDISKICNYIRNAHVIAVTSKMNFPNPFTPDLQVGSVCVRTDGEWYWLDNLADLIELHHVAIPLSWLSFYGT